MESYVIRYVVLANLRGTTCGRTYIAGRRSGRVCAIRATWSEAEWRLVEPLIPPAKRGGRKRSINVREVLNGIFYVLSTGCQWKALPKDLPPKSTVYDYLDLWSWDGRWHASIMSFT